MPASVIASRCAAECDELEDRRCTRTIGSASRLALRLPGRAGDKLQGQASTWLFARIPVRRHWTSSSNCCLSGSGRPITNRVREGKQSISVSSLQTHSRQKIRTGYLQAVASGLGVPSIRALFRALLQLPAV